MQVKTKPFGTLIALCLTALLVYIVTLCASDDMPIAVISALCIGVTAFFSLGISLSAKKTSLNITVISILFLLAFTTFNIIAGVLSLGAPALIIVNGALLILYALIVRGVWNTKQ